MGDNLPDLDTQIDRELGKEREGFERTEGSRDGELCELGDKARKTGVFVSLGNKLAEISSWDRNPHQYLRNATDSKQRGRK